MGCRPSLLSAEPATSIAPICSRCISSAAIFVASAPATEPAFPPNPLRPLRPLCPIRLFRLTSSSLPCPLCYFTPTFSLPFRIFYPPSGLLFRFLLFIFLSDARAFRILCPQFTGFQGVFLFFLFTNLQNCDKITSTKGKKGVSYDLYH